jgi:drug/metabolite transporter (DMT)-like permease
VSDHAARSSRWLPGSAAPYLALAGLALIWGGSFFLIKIAVHDIGPVAMVLIRSCTGSLALAVIMSAMGRPLLPRDWKRLLVPFAVMAVASGVFPWAAIAWGEERITSGLASILNATTPLWTAVFAYWVVPMERPTILNYAGVLIGLGGVVILVLPTIVASGLNGDALGIAAVLLAAVSYAGSILYQRRKLRGVDVYTISLGQLALTAVFSAPLAASSLPAIHLELRSVAAILTLGIAGSGIAYVLYYFVLNSLGPVRGSGVTLLVPVTAVFWGVTLLHEALTIPIVAGMVVILAGIVLTNVRRRAPQVEPVAESEAATA